MNNNYHYLNIDMKSKELSEIVQKAKSYFPFLSDEHSFRLLNRKDINSIIRLRANYAEKGWLKQDSIQNILSSMNQGLWFGIFSSSHLIAYTAISFYNYYHKVILHFKGTVKTDIIPKGFQKSTLQMRLGIGHEITSKRSLNCIGSYLTVHKDNIYSINNILQAGFKYVTHIKGLFPYDRWSGDRNIYASGCIREITKFILEKYSLHINK